MTGNVGADSLTRVVLAGSGVDRVRNPLAAAGGLDVESIKQVQLYAPQAFRTQERAITEADYAAAAERHPEVQKAAATLRWTGSWYTVFITVDRMGGLPVDADFEKKLRIFIERFRMAGQDLEIDAPLFVPLDIIFTVCVNHGYYRAHVKEELLKLFSSRDLLDGRRGFFHPDQFHLWADVVPEPDDRAGDVGSRRQVGGRPGYPEQTQPFPPLGSTVRWRIRRRKNDLWPAGNCTRWITIPPRPRMVASGFHHGRWPVTEQLDNCGCCEPAPEPSPIYNRPGLPALSYRVGTYATFLRRMSNKLGRYTLPDGDNAGERPLADLATRATDDPSIALLDAAAVVADVLTFYQERIANEGFLRTATERRSVLEMARAIGYELNPGVAATAYLTFTVEDAEGAPGISDVPAGTQVMSIPPQGQLPQTFETSEDITARKEWNAIRCGQVRLRRSPPPASRFISSGTSTNLQPGDHVLLVTGHSAGSRRLSA